MDGGIAGGIILDRAVFHALAHRGDGPGDQVVHKGAALGGQLDGAIGQHDVVIHQGRAVADLDKQVLAQAQAFLALGPQQVIMRQAVIVEQVARHPGALGLPVQPDAAGAVVEMVAPDDHVEGGVELDAADLSARQVALVVDVVDVIILDYGKYAAQVAHDAGLPAIVDVAVFHRMGADGFLAPSVQLGDQRAIPLGLRAVLELVPGPFVVVVLLAVLAQGDAGALGMGYLAVIDHPALGPVRADHALLQRGGRRPLRGRHGDDEAGQGDAVHMLLRREEAARAHIDIHLLAVGVSPPGSWRTGWSHPVLPPGRYTRYAA